MNRVAEEIRNRSGRWLAVLGLLRHVPPVLLVAAVLLNVLLGVLPLGFVVGMSVLLHGLPEAAGGAPGAWEALLAVLTVTGGAFVAQQVSAPFQSALGELVTRRVDQRCRGMLMEAALREVPATALDDPRSLDRLGAAREAFDRASASPGDAAAGALALIARYTQLAGAVALVGYAISPVAAAVIGATALAIRFGQRGSLGAFGDFYDGLAHDRRKASYVKSLATGVHTAKEVRLLGLLGWLRSRYAAEHGDYLAVMWRGRRRLLAGPFLLLSAVGVLGASAVLGMLVAEVAQGRTDLLRLGIALQAVMVLMRFGVYFPECDVQTQYGSIAYRALTAFRDEAHGRPALEVRAARSADGLPQAAIRFQGVGFAYPHEDRRVLEGIDLELPAGTSTAVVGLNGAGKTTLVKLLTRLYDPTSGSITADGIDLREIDPHAWYRRLSVVFQDFVRYELSAAENIALGTAESGATEADLREALRRAGAEAVVDALPDGLHTVLSREYRGGRDLSGGQWQRIVLARALHAARAGAGVMVLDEPTAQLDVRAEVEFFDRFLDITEGMTTLIISHRFSTVRHADQIVVLEHGGIAERGTHEELVAAGGRYAELFRLQAERFTTAEHDPDPRPLSDAAS
ncbi:ABC transporter ATP-binding protein [Nocardiopsis baichengensis]|uniref:ABC transporter ATP-binding protein n=1 Tax=Nocardiopsis baichengensis TaxID=280240 RepID=UPI00034D4A84|nr:ABC transporter ATP-binding protein [Nocardiopsis baichengensis]